jgi:hypothetical protein
MGKLLSDILVLVGSTFKFSMGSLTAIFYNLGIAGSLANIIGGTIGIVVFTYLGDFIQTWFIKKFPNYFGKRFTPTNRFLVKVKQKFGLGGVAAFTPIILSIPVGVLFALALTHDKKKIMFSMIVSMLFWATVLFLPYFLFNVNIFGLLKNMFE